MQSDLRVLRELSGEIWTTAFAALKGYYLRDP
jgi:hypothetical protein